MKRIITLALAAGLIFCSSAPSQAVDFKASGKWLFGFTGGQGGLINKVKDGNGVRSKNSNDKFEAAQRLRIKLEAVASENLSGTVYFELGTQTWGKGVDDHGGALGADGKVVKLKNAYLDWIVPDTNISVRMGIQGVSLPNAAGYTAIFDDDVAGVTASCSFNDNVGLTFMWARPFNDNYTQGDWSDSGRGTSNDRTNYLDNMDLFMLSLPLKFDGVSLTPWIMYGMIGQNALGNGKRDGYYSTFMTSGYDAWSAGGVSRRISDSYTNAFWAGLPVKLTLWDPLNIEIDLNYGYVGSTGYGDLSKLSDGKTITKRFSTEAQGWLAKALVEYKMDWGTPGIFGWYASGDDDNPKNGSERMPTIAPCGAFTSFFGDGNHGWGTSGQFYDRSLSYSGTWGIGLQVADMSFIENLKHTFRVVLRGGTNSPSMAKYANTSYAWGSSNDGFGNNNYELYLTTQDKLLEFNLVNAWKVYENLELNLELGYVANMIDHDTWKKAGDRNTSFQKQDAWKAQLIFAYTF